MQLKKNKKYIYCHASWLSEVEFKKSATNKQIKPFCVGAEPRISCDSHITTSLCTLTCKLVVDEDDSEDYEDGEADDIEEMKAWWGV